MECPQRHLDLSRNILDTNTDAVLDAAADELQRGQYPRIGDSQVPRRGPTYEMYDAKETICHAFPSQTNTLLQRLGGGVAATLHVDADTGQRRNGRLAFREIVVNANYHDFRRHCDAGGCGGLKYAHTCLVVHGEQTARTWKPTQPIHQTRRDDIHISITVSIDVDRREILRSGSQPPF